MLKGKNLTCGYGPSFKISLGSFEFNPGITFLLGPNGSGKSTFLKTLAGVLLPLVGEILFNGETLKPGNQKIQRPGYLPSTPELHSHLTGLDILEIMEVQNSHWYSAETYSAIEIEPLEKKYLGEMSSGELKRLLIFATLCHPSKALLFDEPLNYLDVSHSLSLVPIIQNQIEKGRLIVMATHDLNWTLRFERSQALVFNHGQLVHRGNLQRAFELDAVHRAFKFQSQITDNPIDRTKILAIAPMKRDNLV